MKPTELLERAFSDGVQVSLNGVDKIKLTGNQGAIEVWLPTIKEHKEELVRLLSGGLEADSLPDPPARAWTPGNPFICSCGDATGWTLDGKTLCPVCYYDRLHGRRGSWDLARDAGRIIFSGM